MLKWSFLIYSCCGDRLPMIILCRGCQKNATGQTVEAVPEYPPNPLPNSHKHRLGQGRQWAKTGFSCALCNKGMSEVVLCSDCPKEANDVIDRAHQIDTRTELKP